MTPSMYKSHAIASPIDVERISSMVHRRCGDLGVTVTFCPRAVTAYTNGKDITFPALKQPITQDMLDTLYGYAIHETGHHLRPDCFKILKSARPPPHLCALFNIIEDDGMERERAMAWKGDRTALSVMNDILIREISDSWKPTLEDGKQGTCAPEPLAVLCLQQESRLNWDTISGAAIEHMRRSLPKDVQALYATLKSEGWVQRFRDTVTVQDTWDLAVDMAQRLYPGHDPEYEELRKEGHKMQTPANDNDPCKVISKGEGGVDPDAEGSVVSWKDVVLSEHNEWQPKDGAAGTVGIDWAGKFNQPKGVALMPLHMINVIDLKVKGRKSREAPSYRIADYLPNNAEARQFANRIRRYLQAQQRSKVTRHKYHGKLDKASIVKLALPPIDGGEYNKKIFYDQYRHTFKDTAIFVLTDWSGSMNGNKKKHAADASQRLVYTMERVLRIPVALACFSNGKTRCDIGYIKPYGTRGLSQEEIARRFYKFNYYTSANNDADALNWAYYQLKRRHESRKILIVLSDGCPAGSWAGHGGQNLKYITKQIEKEGKIELYGVGIHSTAVKEYYANYRVLNDASEINATLFNLIREGDTT